MGDICIEPLTVGCTEIQIEQRERNTTREGSIRSLTKLFALAKVAANRNAIEIAKGYLSNPSVKNLLR